MGRGANPTVYNNFDLFCLWSQHTKKRRSENENLRPEAGTYYSRMLGSYFPNSQSNANFLFRYVLPCTGTDRHRGFGGVWTGGAFVFPWKARQESAEGHALRIGHGAYGERARTVQREVLSGG